MIDSTPPDPDGIKYEHILISVRIAHNRSIGQFDDSVAHHIQKNMMEYQGIQEVHTTVHYCHGKEEQHFENCDCGWCSGIRSPQPLGDERP